MSGTGTKQKKTPPPAPPPAAASSAPTIVMVTNGDPSPDPVTVAPGARIQFTNNDTQGYLIELLSVKGNTPAINVMLPALASITLMVNPASSAGTTEYNLLVIKQPVGIRTDTGGGGGRIIINP